MMLHKISILSKIILYKIIDFCDKFAWWVLLFLGVMPLLLIIIPDPFDVSLDRYAAHFHINESLKIANNIFSYLEYLLAVMLILICYKDKSSILQKMAMFVWCAAVFLVPYWVHNIQSVQQAYVYQVEVGEAK